jgi:succinate-semialdehyde dehydrogenase/glutarate-semialdehyde dehydrogenase
MSAFSQHRSREDQVLSTTIPQLSRPDFLDGVSSVRGSRETGRDGIIRVNNPATGQQLGEVAAYDAQQTADRVASARLVQPAWAQASATNRAEVLSRFHDLMRDNREDLARIMVAEQGKPLAEARGEVDYAASFLKWFAEEGRRIYGETIPGPSPDKRIMVLKRPIGIAAAVTPWNFPAAMITRKVAPALAAGNAIIVKPSELTPFSALALAKLALEAGLPEGLFSVVTGHPAAIGSVLTSHPDIGKFSFTGSTAVGKLLAAQCATTMKRVSMELGGNAPLLIFDDANIDEAVDGVMMAKFRNSGQTCVCANRLLVQDGIHDRFVDALTARVQALRVGNGLDGVTDQGPLIDKRALEKISGHVADAVGHGARVITGGSEHGAGSHFWTPTILSHATEEMRVAQEESFGPIAPIFRFTSEADALRLANATRSGLAAYAFTKDIDRFWRLAEALETGMVGFNTGAISSEVAPFGGVKESGIGREGSHHGIDEYLNLRMICLAVPHQQSAM